MSDYSGDVSKIEHIIEDAFSNTLEDKNNRMVETIFTKTNKKPAKTTVDNLVAKCYRQIVLLYKKINKSFEENDYEIDNDNECKKITLFFLKLFSYRFDI